MYRDSNMFPQVEGKLLFVFLLHNNALYNRAQEHRRMNSRGRLDKMQSKDQSPTAMYWLVMMDSASQFGTENLCPHVGSRRAGTEVSIKSWLGSGQVFRTPALSRVERSQQLERLMKSGGKVSIVTAKKDHYSEMEGIQPCQDITIHLWRLIWYTEPVKTTTITIL